MTMAISHGRRAGRQGRHLRLHRQHLAPPPPPTPTAAGMTCAVLVPEGKIAMGKLSQAIAHGATLLQVDGNFDDCLTLARKLAEAYPVELVNSVNPARIEGQKTAAFEIVDALGDAPDIHCLPVGNAGNITAYWQGYREYRRRGAQPGPATRLPRMWGFQAAGAAPIVAGPPGRPARDHRHRDPDRQPGVLGAGRAGAGRVRRPDRGRHRRADPGRAPAAVRRRRASSSSPRRPPASPGCSRPHEAGPCSRRASASSARSPATGSRTRSGRCAPPTAPRSRRPGCPSTRSPRPRRSASRADRVRRAPRGPPRSGVRRAGAPAPTSAPASTRSGSPSALCDELRGRTLTSAPGLAIEVERRGRRRGARDDERHLVVRAMLRAWAGRSACTRRRAAPGVPQRGPARPRPGLLGGRDRRRASSPHRASRRCAGRRWHDERTRPVRQRPRQRARGPPGQRRRPRVLGGLTVAWTDDDGPAA